MQAFRHFRFLPALIGSPLPAALVLLLLTGYAPASRAAGKNASLYTLASYLCGSFTNSQQAAGDSAYFEIQQHVVPIWTERRDGFWMYLEQAMAARPDDPYRQKVYHLTALNETLFSCEVFNLRAPARFAGAWKEPRPLGALKPDSLEPQEGCDLILRLHPKTATVGLVFTGSTLARDCANDMRGATYAVSEVEIGPYTMTSWDRGLDRKGRQVWGTQKGPYKFRKIEDWSGRLRRP